MSDLVSPVRMLAPAPVAARAGAALGPILAAQQGRRAPWLAVALGSGILLYFARADEPASALPWLASGGLLAVAGVLLGLRARGAEAWRWLAFLTALPAALLLGFGVAAWHAGRLPPPLDLPAGAVILSGRVESLQPLPEGLRLVLAAPQLGEGPALPRTLRLRLRADDPARPQPGDRLSVRALVRPPPGPVAPDAWDFARAAFFAGQGGSATALGSVALTPGLGGGAPLAGLRADLDREVAAAIGGSAGAVAAALLTGTQSAIDEAAMQAMRDSGLAHLLSVSGLHMTIVMGLVFGLLRLLIAAIPFIALRLPGKAVAALGAFAAGAFYMVLTGMQVPMQRCLAMAALVTLGLLVGRRVVSVRGLGLAAALVMLAAPAELLGPSFQMSFAAVLALVAGHRALAPRITALSVAHPGPAMRAWMVLAGVVLTSVLAGLATAPIGLHHFGRLQAYGVLANALAVPITSFWVMPAGVLSLLLMPLGLEAWPLAVMGWGTQAILWVASWVAALPFAAPAAPILPAEGLALAALGFCILCIAGGRVALAGLPLLAAGLAAGLVIRPPDLLVAADARQVAVRTQDGWMLHRLAGASAFVTESWARRLGVVSFGTLPAEGDGPGFACTASACRITPRPGAAEILLLRTAAPARGARSGPAPDAAALAAGCGQVALVVATEPIRARCDGSARIDRFTVWRHGAQAVWVTAAGARLRDAATARGDRPWVPPAPAPGRPEALPLAPRDPAGH